MSRETDSSSSGPQGRGGAAYPSGTPPYGTRPFPSLHPQERPRPAGAPGPDGAPETAGQDGAPAAQPPAAGEPRTETTLTTRIRINIPGSRPIPPVVVRTPVDENTAAPAAAAAAPPAPVEADRPEPPQAPAPEGEGDPDKKEPSDWFAPRKPVSGAPGPSTDGGTGTGAGAAEPAPPARGFTPSAPDPYTDPFAEAFTSPPADPLTDPLSGPLRGGFSDPDTGSTQNPYLPPPVGGPMDGGPAARGPHDTPANGFASPFGAQEFPPGVPRASDPYADPAGPPPDAPFPGYQPPAGPTSAATGSMRMPPMTAPDAPTHSGTGTGTLGPGGPGSPSAFDGLSAFDGPGGPRTGEFPPPGERVSGDTLVSGIPAVPPGEVRGPRPPAPAPAQEGAPDSSPSAPATPAPAPAARPAKKGRSKLVLLAVAVGGVLVVGYGVGLLMNHADVPKGTTVLGVDIGDMTQDSAVQTLNKALGDRTTAPITLTIGGRKQTLKPSVAGLSLDTNATVRAVAHADYNPVSVVGSLFGGTRKAAPVFLVDNDKLKAALSGLAGRTGTGSDGMVKFAAHKAIAVPGKPGSSFDVDSAASQVAAAYRTRAETGADQPVALAVTDVPPKVTQAELDKAVNGFGRTAMQGPAVVTAGGVHHIAFNTTLPQFLTMVPDQNGTLHPHIDLTILRSLYGATFDGVVLKRSDGSTGPVTPQDVATMLVQALGSATNRTATLPGVVH